MLEARDLAFAYPGAAPVLQGVSLCVAPGERVALTAPSGRGKTTLCQLLAGYLQPARGQVLADGAPLPTRGACPVQMIWQHPERVLDPRLTLGRSLEQAGAPQQRVVEALGILCRHARENGHTACVMCFTEHVSALADCRPHDIGSMHHPEEVAHRLFDTLRRLDEERMDVIFSEVMPPEGMGLAVMNRLGRAAAFRTVQARDVCHPD